MVSASDSGTEGERIAMQKEWWNTELVSGDCRAASMANTQMGEEKE